MVYPHHHDALIKHTELSNQRVTLVKLRAKPSPPSWLSVTVTRTLTHLAGLRRETLSSETDSAITQPVSERGVIRRQNSVMGHSLVSTSIDLIRETSPLGLKLDMTHCRELFALGLVEGKAGLL